MNQDQKELFKFRLKDAGLSELLADESPEQILESLIWWANHSNKWQALATTIGTELKSIQSDMALLTKVNK